LIMFFIGAIIWFVLVLAIKHKYILFAFIAYLAIPLILFIVLQIVNCVRNIFKEGEGMAKHTAFLVLITIGPIIALFMGPRSGGLRIILACGLPVVVSFIYWALKKD
jgi:hypothetical protein